MKNIFLFRHGKSSWSDPMFDDHERPLADRGIRDVPLISKIINESGICKEKLEIQIKLKIVF